jgi:signal transduction histidine kinase
MMAVPLFSKDEVIGILRIRSTRPNAYSEKDLRLAEKVGIQIAGAVANAQLFATCKQTENALRKSEEDAKRLAQENALVAEMGRIIGSTPNIDEVFDRFSKEVAKLIPFERIQITLGNLPAKETYLRYVSGIDVPGRRAGEYTSLSNSATAECLRTKSNLFLQPRDAKEVQALGARFPGLLPNLEAGMRSFILVPLISKDEAIGALSLRTTKIQAYTERDVRLAESIASQIAGAVANAKLFAESKRAEEERKVLGERLGRAEKMEAVGTLAGGVAHDLNNVLGVLVGYSELMLLDLPEGSPLRKHVSQIMQSGQKAAAIIQDLLTLARRGVSISGVVNANDLVANHWRSPEFEKLKSYHPGVTFQFNLDKDLLNIKGSAVHLEKTVMNLLSNAAEAIDGRGEVTLVTENCYLDRPVTGYDHIQQGDYVVLKVVDTGRGISSKDLQKIFEPFYTKKVMGRSGTGLGLAIVWGTVKDHSGYIDVQSEEGKGTAFTLYFPVTRDEKVTDQQAMLLETYMGKGESILVVDDVKEQRELATIILNGLGYQVSSVSSGEEAVEYLRTNKVDLMVLDMIMDPGMDGLDTYQKVLEVNPGQKAIIVSGFSETERVKRAMELGAGAYVKKPYIREKIGLAVRKELDR